jgi:hypothetical protein
MYELSLETFRYNGEIITTGYPDIDNIADVRAFGVDYTMAAGGTNTYKQHEIVYQGATLETATAKGYVSYWDKPSRILRIRNAKGEFQPNVAVKGTAANGNWIISSGNFMEDATTTFDDNVRIEQEADNILDWSETNPFGSANEP